MLVPLPPVWSSQPGLRCLMGCVLLQPARTSIPQLSRTQTLLGFYGPIKSCLKAEAKLSPDRGWHRYCSIQGRSGFLWIHKWAQLSYQVPPSSLSSTSLPFSWRVTSYLQLNPSSWKDFGISPAFCRGSTSRGTLALQNFPISLNAFAFSMLFLGWSAPSNENLGEISSVVFTQSLAWKIKRHLFQYWIMCRISPAIMSSGLLAALESTLASLSPAACVFLPQSIFLSTWSAHLLQMIKLSAKICIWCCAINHI